MSADLSLHRQRFLDYTAEFSHVPDAAPLRLKVEHTFRVMEHARRITETLYRDSGVPDERKKDGEACRAAVLAALYHDCGRFPQFARFRTFLDAKSVNHALLSFQVMRDRHFLQEENAAVRGLAQCAVLLHNRYALPPLLEKRARFVTDIVRDSDKLDIFRIMAGYLDGALPEKDAVLLHVQDDPRGWTSEVAEDVLCGRVAKYTDLHYVNDFRLLLGTWMWELRFACTRRTLAESGLVETVLAPLPKSPALKPALTRLYDSLEACRQG